MLPISTAYAAFAGVERIRRDACIIGFAFYNSDDTPFNDVAAQGFELSFQDDAGVTVLTKSGAAIVVTLPNRLQVELATADKNLLSRQKYTYTLYNTVKKRTEVMGSFTWQKGRPSAQGLFTAADLKIVYQLVTGMVSIGGLVVIGQIGPQGVKGLNWRGAWTANTSYAMDDAVTNGGNSYRRKAPGTSGASFDPTNWDVIAQGSGVSDGAEINLAGSTSKAIMNRAATDDLVSGRLTKAITGVNVFNPALVQQNKAIGQGGGGEIFALAGYISSPYVPVLPGEKWVISGIGSSKGIRYEAADHSLISGAGLSNTGTTAITIPAGAYWMIFTVKNSSESAMSATIQVERGTVATAYQPIQQAVTAVDTLPVLANLLADGAILTNPGNTPASVITRAILSALFTKRGVLNLFNPAVTLAKAVDQGGNGNLYNGLAGFLSSDYLPVLPGEKYTFSNVGLKKGVRFETADHTLISGASLSSSTSTTVTIPALAAWMIFTVKADTESAIPATFQVQKGSIATAWQSFQSAVATADGSPILASVLADGATMASPGTDPTSIPNKAQVDALILAGILAKLSLRIAPNQFNPANVQVGKAVGQGGGGEIYTGLAGYIASEYIPVVPGEKWTFSGMGGSKGIRWEAADHSLVAGGYVPASATTVTVPAGAAWLIFNVKIPAESTIPPTMQVEKGSYATAYFPYGGGQITSINSNPIAPWFHATTTGKKLLIFGDSIATMWPSYIQSPYWGAVSNQAISSAWTKDKPTFTDAGESLYVQIQRAIDAGTQPDVIALFIGTNDSPNTNIGTFDAAMTKTTLASLDRANSYYEALRYAYWKISTQWPNARIFHATPLQRADRTLAQTKQITDAIKQMAAVYCVRVIDAEAESGIVAQFEVVNGQGKYLTDGVHPGTAGRQLLADYYMRKITAAIV